MKIRSFLLVCLIFLAQFSNACISQPKIPDDVLAAQKGPFTLLTSITPAEGGYINSVQGEYTYGDQVTITATPATGYVFMNWDGDLSGNTSSITLTINRDINVIANFARLSTLQVDTDPLNFGTVLPSNGTYGDGSLVTVTAYPVEGYALNYWSGAAAGTSNSTIVTIEGDTRATAHFTKIYTSTDHVISFIVPDIELTTSLPNDLPASLTADQQLSVGQMYVVVRLRIVSVTGKLAAINQPGTLYDIENQPYQAVSYFWNNVKERNIENNFRFEIFEGSTGIILFKVPAGMPVQKLSFSFFSLDSWSPSGAMIYPKENLFSIDLLRDSGTEIPTPVIRDNTSKVVGATLYWIGGTGSTSDASHYSLASGGISARVTPNQTSPVVFDKHSGFTATGMSVTFDQIFNCNDFIVTGVPNKPAFQGSADVNIFGSFTNDSAITWSKTGTTAFRSHFGTNTIKTGGMLFGTGSGLFQINGSGGIFRLTDDVSFGGTIELALTAGTFDPNGMTVNCVGTGNSLTTDWNFSKLRVVSTASKTDTFTITSGKTITVTDSLSFNGNSQINRLLVQSGTTGNPASIDAKRLTGSNVDFMDIASAHAVDLSAITGLSGDCGGNTNITFTTPMIQTWAGGTGLWSDSKQWSSRTPLPQDSATVNTTGLTCTIDMPRVGGTVELTGTGTVSLSTSINNYGSFIMASGLTYKPNNHINVFRGRGQYSIDTNSNSLYRFFMRAPGGTYVLLSNFVQSGTNNPCYLDNGTLDMNGYDMMVRAFSSANDNARGLLLRSGTLTLASTSDATVLDFSVTTNLAFDAGSSTIIFNLNANHVFKSDGLTLSNVEITGASEKSLTISGNNKFNNFYIDASQSPKTIIFIDGTTQIVSGFTRDTSDNIITLTGKDSGKWALISTSVRPVALDYMDVSGLQALDPDMWYMGTHSKDSGLNNANVIFEKRG